MAGLWASNTFSLEGSRLLACASFALALHTELAAFENCCELKHYPPKSGHSHSVLNAHVMLPVDGPL